MKVYELKTKQIIPVSMEEAWDFFSSPSNLKNITPDYLGFKILSDLGDSKMYPGQIINYVVKPVLGIPMKWTTEITHVEHHKYFVDEQRFGPYAMWHHKHFFKEVDGKVEMTDIVHYALPFWQFGFLSHPLFVKAKLKEIFDFRYKKVEELFGKA